MRTPVFLCFIFLVPVAYSAVKVLKFYGTMTWSCELDFWNGAYMQSDLAANTCYQKNDCVAMSDCSEESKCKIHHDNLLPQLTLHEAKDGNKSFVIIKTIVPDGDCPNNYTDVDFKFLSSAGDIYSWKKVNGIWKFESCKEGWKRFERSSKIVCIKPLKLDGGVLKERAMSECIALNAVLVGVETVAESLWMSEQVTNLTDSTADHAFWLPGMRSNKCSQSDSFGYKTNFIWDDGLTDTRAAFTTENSDVSCLGSEGEDERCWAIMNKKDGRTATLFDVACGGSMVMQGAFCGYKLYNE